MPMKDGMTQAETKRKEKAYFLKFTACANYYIQNLCWTSAYV